MSEKLVQNVEKLAAQNVPNNEIARQLGVSEARVKRIKDRARKRGR